MKCLKMKAKKNQSGKSLRPLFTIKLHSQRTKQMENDSSSERPKNNI